MSAGKQKLVKRQLFPEKLWDLVNKPASGIRWSQDGKRIEVERSQLEKFNGTKFRSRNFDSFIRQLHFYGFRKTGNSYHHDKFQRNQPEALLTMKRKYSNHTPLTPFKNGNVKSPDYTTTTGSNISHLSSSMESSCGASNSSTSMNAVAANLISSTLDATSGAIDLSGAVAFQDSTSDLTRTIPLALDITSSTDTSSQINLSTNRMFAIKYSSSAKLKHVSLFRNPSKSIRLSSNKLLLYIEE